MIYYAPVCIYYLCYLVVPIESFIPITVYNMVCDRQIMSGASSSSRDTASVTETEKQRLIREFVLITKTDSKCATFFLENHEWKLQVRCH